MSKMFCVAPSVSDGKDRNASRRARALQKNSGAGRLSKICREGVRNVLVLAPSVSDGRDRNASRRARALQKNSGANRLSKICREGVQNGGNN